MAEVPMADLEHGSVAAEMWEQIGVPPMIDDHDGSVGGIEHQAVHIGVAQATIAFPSPLKWRAI